MARINAKCDSRSDLSTLIAERDDIALGLT
jgi:hypothetical protein